MTRSPRHAAAVFVVATILAAGSVRFQHSGLPAAPHAPPIHIPLWVPLSQVRHETRSKCVWDGAAPLAGFRQAENLDAVAGGAASDEERARKLLHWTRAQFEPGRPDPYPPPDATTTLSEIRAGRTGGFCAQYAFVLVQALQSLGTPARVVTIESHEVVETWLADQRRWTMLDPMFELQVIDARGRSLSAIEIRDAQHARAALAVTAGNRLPEPAKRYFARYDQIALWIRNAFVSAPENFSDFELYRVWLFRGSERSPSPESLRTAHPEGLYGAPREFPDGRLFAGG